MSATSSGNRDRLSAAGTGVPSGFGDGVIEMGCTFTKGGALSSQGDFAIYVFKCANGGTCSNGALSCAGAAPPAPAPQPTPPRHANTVAGCFDTDASPTSVPTYDQPTVKGRTFSVDASGNETGTPLVDSCRSNNITVNTNACAYQTANVYAIPGESGLFYPGGRPIGGTYHSCASPTPRCVDGACVS